MKKQDFIPFKQIKSIKVMKQKSLLLAFFMLLSFTVGAQNSTQARQILNKTASVIERKGGASANFHISGGKIGSASGTIAIKGNKFRASTAKAMVWYNGKTQWTYMKSSNEVNVSNPTEAQQMSMNPYTFINMYKNGYALSMTTVTGGYMIHLTAQNKKRSVQELYITVNKSNYLPTKIRMRQGNSWTNIVISNFRAKNLSDGTFTFSAKDFPKAEIIDLR